MPNRAVENRALDRLNDLVDSPSKVTSHLGDKSGDSQSRLEFLDDRLGRAGYLSLQSRQYVYFFQWMFVALLGGLVVFWGAAISSRSKFISLLLIAFAVGYFLIQLFFRWREREIKRQILFGLPIFLESIILIVESGIGLLPALSRVIRIAEPNRSNFVTEIFGIVYHLSAAGVPFSRALEMVSEKLSNRTLQHVMLHLELSGVEGGELIPSLRSLSEHVHKEWQLSVEERVKRLENLVVFPVFVSVIGLILLTASVPLVSVLGMKDKLRDARGSISVGNAPETISNIGEPL